MVKYMYMKEPHYLIDSINYNDNSEYLREGGITDTRLAKMYSGDGQYWVLRAPSIEDNRRLQYPEGTYVEVKKEFDNLIGELKLFDIQVPKYSSFVSDFHTSEGQRGKGLCIASEYIHGKCLPMENCNGLWDMHKNLYYNNMNKWAESMTAYMVTKYLSADKNSYFLADVCRPIQFVYSFDDSNIYLVDLDPLYSRVFNENGTINQRFLISIATLNLNRNKYFNKGYSEGVIDRKWGEKSRLGIRNLLLKSSFMDRVDKSEYSQNILKNMLGRIENP